VKLENDFHVKVPVERAWEVLTDIPEIAPCMPGAQLTGSEGDAHQGKVKIKVGPITAEYKGSAQFVERDEANHRVVIDAKGRDARGSGNASALITAVMTTEGDGTRVAIETDLKIAGKVAQFGKGVIGDVSKKLIDQFVACVETKFDDDSGQTAARVAGASAEMSEAAAASSAAPADATTGAAAKPAAEKPLEALDLMDAAGGAVFKRLAPIGAVLAAILVYLIVR
jgi:carbon monoxide dehydrogenase subunit G